MGRLMNLDLDCDHEFYLSLCLQRMRAMMSSQIGTALNNGRAAEMEENHRQILQLLTCGDGSQSTMDVDDGKDAETELTFDQSASAAPWNSMLKVPELKPVEMKGDDEKIADQFDPKDVSPATLRVVEGIMS